MQGTVAFRADASSKNGYGHVMRCLALADQLRHLNYDSVFVSSPSADALDEEIVSRGHMTIKLPEEYSVTEDAQATLKLIEGFPMRGMVVDHYLLDEQWEAVISQQSIPLLAIDDLNRLHRCEILLDQNFLGEVNPYESGVPQHCLCLLGPSFALLAESFSECRASTEVRTQLHRVLVFFGGSDPSNETAKALRALINIEEIHQIDVVIGAANSHKSAIEFLCKLHAGKVELHIQTPFMANLMASADLAIGAGGSASWERCCLRLPSIVSVLADNQRPIATSLHAIGAVINLGDASALGSEAYYESFKQLNDQQITFMSSVAGGVVDGLGASRVAQVFHEKMNEA